ncbi:neuropeptides capa receptor-like [Diadema setosum]|uniref:neuropeptides capa receptor-like n=1 Tax=Diadema setosum TaxID=31175 RepID=UPI003B3B0E53
MEPNFSACSFTENVTTEQDAEGYKYSTWGVIYTLGFLPFIISIGVVDNLAFIFVVSRVPRMHTSTNCYLINLALADILFLTTGTVEKLYRYSQSPIHGDDTPIKNGGCVWIYLVSDTSYYAALFFVSLVSIERYCAVCTPQNRYIFNKKKTYVLVSVSWIVSLCLALTQIPSTSVFLKICLHWPNGRFKVHLPDSWGICTAVHPWIRMYANGMQTIPFFIAMVLNSAMYIKIVGGLNDSLNRLKSHSGGTTETDARMRDQIARMLVINGIAFFSCLAPFEILSLLNITEDNFIDTDVFTSLVYAARALAYINCAINPIIYTIMSQRYRYAFHQTFLQKKKKRHNTAQSCTMKFLGSTTQDQLRTTVCESRI